MPNLKNSQYFDSLDNYVAAKVYHNLKKMYNATSAKNESKKTALGIAMNYIITNADDFEDFIKNYTPEISMIGF